jgi:alkylation response protein AidB-like acyl-CoA dehydrogenase
MWRYDPPLAQMQFVMQQVLRAGQQWAATPAFADLDDDTAREVLQQAGRFASEVLAPINAAGDAQGCALADGQVRTPPGFKEAYAAFVAGGWPALACSAEAGGQGLPQLLNAALYEMLAAANHGWVMYPGLLHGAYEVIHAHATPALKALYHDAVMSGRWLATMCLTEPQAGSDLGLVRTRADLVEGEPANGAPVRISGSKIFISGGDHDLTDNIVHLVLCRLAGAPAGTKGLSLALVPKLLPDGRRNAAFCDGIEHKMGIHGSATCQMRFENAEGWLIGEPHRGLAAMFLMMNAARLHVGLQGLGHLEAATQNAWRYAAERTQMRAAQRPEGVAAGAAADPIALHPAMRRTLWTLRARTDGARVLAYHTALRLDAAEQHPEAAERARANSEVALLTPVVKAFLTHWGHVSADEALQVWGGYGFVREYGIEQTVRDSRIAMIYEGTNEIQAIDLLLRKVLDDGGARLWPLLDALAEEATRCEATGEAQAMQAAQALRGQLAAWRQATEALLAGRAADPGWALRVADDYLHGAGHALLAFGWAALLRTGAQLGPDALDPEARTSVQAARYGLQWLLPQAQVHWQRVQAREAELPWLP